MTQTCPCTTLRIDVWDFNWDENVTDKFRKINEIKDARGIRNSVGSIPIPYVIPFI